MRATTQIGRRGRALIVLCLAALGASTAAWAYWSAPSSGQASGRVASLAAPAISSATPGGGTVALAWSSVAAPSGGAVSYYVSRDGGAASAACPGSASPTTQTSCTDTGVPTGGHSYTVTAVWRSWTASSESASALVSSGAATHLVLTPATTTPTAGVGDNLTITAKDASNNTVTSYSGAKSLTFSGASTIGSAHPVVTAANGTATAFGTSESIGFSAGVASVSGSANGAMTLYKAETAGIKVSDGTIENGAGTSVTVAPGSAAGFSLATPATQTAGVAFNETIVANDAYGNTATSYTGSKPIGFSGPSSSPGGKAPSYPSSITFSSGSATAQLTLYAAEASATLTATQGAVSGTAASFAVNPTSAASFALSAPAAQTAGVAFGETLTARDAYGNTATSYTGSKSVGFSGPSSSPGKTAPAYPSSVSFSAGVGTAQITLYDAQTTALTATQSAISGSSSSFTVAAAGASSFAVANPGTQTAGSAFNLALTARDAYGNTATSYAGGKTIAFAGPSTSPAGNAPKYPASVSFAAGEGVAQVTLYSAGATTLTAQEGAVSGSSSSFTVNGLATTSRFGLATPTPTAGAQFGETITAEDAYGNTTTGYGGSKSIGFSGPAKAPDGTSPRYPSSVFFNSGVGNATVTLYAAQTTTLTATQSAISGVSPSFTVAAAGASGFGLATPATQTAGVAFNLTLTAEDGWGNTVTSYEGAKSVTLEGPENSPNGKAPSYPASVSFSAGVGTALVTLYDADPNATIEASQSSINGSTGSFAVNAAATAGLSLGAASLTPSAGASDNLTIAASDAFGNKTTGYSGTKTLTFGGAQTIGANHPTVVNSTGSAVNFGSATQISFTNGEASVQSGSRNGVMRLYAAETAKVTVTDGTLANGSGLSVTVDAGPLAISATNPGTQTAGTAFNLSITAKDSFGNGASGPLALSFSGPESSPSEKAPSYPSSVTFTGGAGTASVTLYDANPTTDVTVAQGAAKGSTGNFVVNAGTAAKLAWQPSTSNQSGEAEGLCLFTCTWRGLGRGHTWSANVSVTDAGGNVVSNIGSGHSVTWTGGPSVGTVSPGSLALPSSGAATTSASVTYTSTSNNWSSDTFTAHSSPYGDATVLLKR